MCDLVRSSDLFLTRLGLILYITRIRIPLTNTESGGRISDLAGRTLTGRLSAESAAELLGLALGRVLAAELALLKG